MVLYLYPIERIGHRRVPRYLKARGQQGLNVRRSMMDFGHTSDIALLASDSIIRAPDVMRLPQVWSQSERDRVGGYLRSAGIESDWVLGAADWREAWQRLAGLAQVYQSAIDDPNTSAKLQDPSAWMGRYIHFGFGKLAPLDEQAYQYDQTLKRIAKREKISEWIQREGGTIVDYLRQRRIPVISGGALPATDSFTRTGAPSVGIETYSSNWSVVQGAIIVYASTDDFEADDAGDCSARWNADTFDDDQYSVITVNAIGSNRYVGASVRNSASAASFYGYEGDNGNDGKYFYKYVSGSYTELASSGNGFSASDTIRIEASGTTITPIRNGSEDTDLGAATDSSLSSGYAGVAGAGEATNISRGDDWEGGNLGGGAFTVNKSETITVSESATAAIQTQIGTTQAVTVSENAVVTLVNLIAKTENITVSEAAQVVLVSLISKSENITVSEAVSLAIQTVLNVSDSIAVAESVTAVLVSFIAAAENITVGENVVATLVNLIAKSENITVSEAVQVVLVSLISVSETITVSESVTAAIQTLINVSENITVGEAVNVSIVLAGALSINKNESITVSESVAAEIQTLIAATENITVDENVIAVLVSLISVVENIAVSEDAIIELVNLIAVSEGISVSESAQIVLVSLVDVSEGITVSESVTAAIQTLINVSETITVTELVNVVLPGTTLNLSVSDAINVSESVAVSIQPPVTPAGGTVSPGGGGIGEYIIADNRPRDKSPKFNVSLEERQQREDEEIMILW